MAIQDPAKIFLVQLPRDATTARAPQLSRTVRGAKREAQRALAALVAEAAAGDVSASKATLSELLARWLETADVALMADDLTKLTEALRIGRRTRQIVRQNLILSIAILAVLVPGALFGLIALPLAVLAHEVSELVVIGNGLRLARR